MLQRAKGKGDRAPVGQTHLCLSPLRLGRLHLCRLHPSAPPGMVPVRIRQRAAPGCVWLQLGCRRVFVDRCARAGLEDGDGRYRDDGTSGVLEIRGIRDSEGARFVDVVEYESGLVVFGLTWGGVGSRESGAPGTAVWMVSRGDRAKTVVSSEAGVEDRPGGDRQRRDDEVEVGSRDAAVAQTGRVWLWLWLQGPLAQAGEI